MEPEVKIDKRTKAYKDSTKPAIHPEFQQAINRLEDKPDLSKCMRCGAALEANKYRKVRELCQPCVFRNEKTPTKDIPVEEHKVVVEQELMRSVILRILQNQKLLLTDCNRDFTPAVEKTRELIKELED